MIQSENKETKKDGKGELKQKIVAFVSKAISVCNKTITTAKNVEYAWQEGQQAIEYLNNVSVG